MTTSRTNLLLGEDYEGWEGFCVTLVNLLKNNWRMSDPTGTLSLAKPGMIVSDEDTEKLWHRLGVLDSGSCITSGSMEWDEVLQENMSCDAFPTFAGLNLQGSAITTESKCRAYLSSAQTNIANTTYTKVLLDATTYDPSSMFDAGNNRIIAPVTGFYLISGSILWTDVANAARWITQIRVGGAQRSARNAHSGSTNALSVEIIDVLQVTAGQAIELYAWHNVGAATPDISADQWGTFLTVHLLNI